MAQANSGLQLQRSAVSFRRQGSSGVVWNDRFFSGEIARPAGKPEHQFMSGELARPNRAPRTRHLSHDRADPVGPSEANVRPIRTVRSNRSQFDSSEPPSPRVSGCGCCGGLGKSPRSGGNVRRVTSRQR